MHAHNHHHHGHHHPKPSSLKALLVAIVLTFGFAIVEAVTGWVSGSLALLSDAGHMVADSLTLIMAAVAAWISNKPPSQKHSYGLGRIEVLTALASTVFLVLVTAWIVIEAIERIKHPIPIHGGMVIWVATIGLLINLVMAYVLSRGEQTYNMRAAVLHIMGDALGSVATIISGIVISLTNWTLIDPILSFLICILILLTSFQLLRETFGVLMESVPAHIDFDAVGQAMAKIEKVISVHDLHIWTLSSGKIVLTAHIIVEYMDDWPSVMRALHSTLEHEFEINHITLQPEPKAEVVKHIPR